MEILREAMGKEKLITFQKKLVRVRRFPGSSLIFVGPDGETYLSYWKTKGDTGKTPRQRRGSAWGPKEKSYR